MKAIIATPDKRAKIIEKELRVLAPGEALLDMECCGVCHTDMHVKDQDFGNVSGITLGHEGIGRVAQIGEGVTSLKVGDRASVAWFFEGCGHCEYCVTGRETLCRSVKNAGFSVDGAMAQQCIVSADYAVKVPEELPSDAASSITCAGVTTYSAVKASGIRPGQWLLVIGLGGLGNLALQYAKNVFGAKVIAADINESQLEFARELGADLVVNPSKTNLLEFAFEQVGGVHAAIVTAVAAAAYNNAANALRAGGRLTAVSVPAGTLNLDIPRTVLDGIQVVGSLVGTRADLSEAFQFGVDGKVLPRCKMRNPEDINEIFDEMNSGSIKGRMVLDLTRL